MSATIKSSNGNAPVQSAPNMEWAHRSLVSSSRQKVFQSVLNQAQSGSPNSSNTETNALKQELNSLQNAGADSQKIDKLRASAQGQGMAQANANPLATSALLNLAAMTSGGSGLSTYLGVLGTGAGGRGGVPAATTPDTPAPSMERNPDVKGLGNLSAQFESGEAGVDVIGYDGNGGTSYGTYQLASRPGTMRNFIGFLEEQAPDWAKRLKAAGPADTGSRRGGMPREWQKIASEDPERLAKLQHDFIEKSHYQPALQEIYERTGVDVEKQSKALQEVLWSTSVQHGPKGAANIFSRVLNSSGSSPANDTSKASLAEGQDLIQSVYASRSKQFGSSTSRIRNSVHRRFQEEKQLALNMLSNERKGISATA